MWERGTCLFKGAAVVNRMWERGSCLFKAENEGIEFVLRMGVCGYLFRATFIFVRADREFDYFLFFDLRDTTLL